MIVNKIINDVVLTKDEILIIGGGTMGLFLANELIKKGQKVVIVEAGVDALKSYTSDEFSSIGQLHKGASLGRTKAIGGTSNLWGGQFSKFIKYDINAKNNYDQPNWPVSWEELNENYEKIFTLFGFKTDFSEYTKTLTNGIEHLEKFHTYWLKQPNFKTLFYADLFNSPLVKIYNGAVVTDLNYENDSCVSVKVKNKEGLFNIIGFKKVVLAQGTIEIIRLLLKTKSKENCPYKNNDYIGKYFQDHIVLKVAQIRNPSKALFNDFTNTFIDGNKLQPKIRLIPQPNDNEYIGISSSFFFSSDISQNLDLLKQFLKAVLGRSQIKMTLKEYIKFFFKSMKSFKYVLPLMFRYIVNNKIYVPFNSSVALHLQTQQIAIKESCVTIDEKLTDSDGMPKVLINWQIDGREFKRINLFCERMKKYILENNYGEVVFEPWYEKEVKYLNNEWKKQIDDSYHIAGGAIMSEHSKNGVVDENLKIHNSSNMFIAGPSVLPTSSYANTGITALSLVLRLSQNL